MVAENTRYSDIIFIGSGPASIFGALKLADMGYKIAIFEKGPPIDKRKCPCIIDNEKPCLRCPVCFVTSGFGGAGAYSDGKLTYSSSVGGDLSKFIERSDFERLMKEVDEIFLSLGAPSKLYGEKIEEIEDWKYSAHKFHLEIVPQKVRHLGTDLGLEILKKMYELLRQKGIEFHFFEQVDDFIVEDNKIKGISTAKGTYNAEYVIAAPGRAGSGWFKAILRKYDIKTFSPYVDLGVRVEVQSAITEPLTSLFYEPKIVYYTKEFDDRVRTFCVNPGGVVVIEYVNGIVSVNGHSYSMKTTENTNFALLVSTKFTEPFDDPNAYGVSIAKLANLLSGNVLVQRFGDLQKGRRTTNDRLKRNPVKPSLLSAVPGDLSFALPYRYVKDITEMLFELDKLLPGVGSPYTLLYGVEVKFYSNRVLLNENMETRIKGLYAAGDGAGITRGLVQAALSGFYIAEKIGRHG